MADNDNNLFDGSEDDVDRDLDQEIEEDAEDEIDEIFDGDEDDGGQYAHGQRSISLVVSTPP